MIEPQVLQNFDSLLLTTRTPEGFKELLDSEVKYQSKRTKIVGLS